MDSRSRSRRAYIFRPASGNDRDFMYTARPQRLYLTFQDRLGAKLHERFEIPHPRGSPRRRDQSIKYKILSFIHLSVAKGNLQKFCLFSASPSRRSMSGTSPRARSPEYPPRLSSGVHSRLSWRALHNLQNSLPAAVGNRTYLPLVPHTPLETVPGFHRRNDHPIPPCQSPPDHLRPQSEYFCQSLPAGSRLTPGSALTAGINLFNSASRKCLPQRPNLCPPFL